MPITTLIADDEPLARDGLREMLAKDPEVGSIHEARDGRQAVEAIQQFRPDLVLLDVQMPEMDGFDVLRSIGAEQMPAVVFVTAHDKYAIQAFEINAIDYLLKPVMEERFVKALARGKSRIQSNAAGGGNPQLSHEIVALLETLAAPRSYVKRLAVRAAGKTSLLNVADVDWIAAAENYVELHAGRQTHMLHVTLQALERSLDPECFLRIHRSLIVNLSRINALEPIAHGEYVVTLETGVRLQSGRTYSGRLKALIENPF